MNIKKTPQVGDNDIEIEGIEEISPDDAKFSKIIEQNTEEKNLDIEPPVSEFKIGTHQTVESQQSRAELTVGKQTTAPNASVKIKMFDKIKELGQSIIQQPDESFRARRLSSRSSTISRKNSKRSSEKKRRSAFEKPDNLNYGMHRMSLAGMVHHSNAIPRRMTVGSSSRSNSDRKSQASNGRPSGGNTSQKEKKRLSKEFDNVMRINQTHNTPNLKENLSAQKRNNSFLTSADKQYAPDDTIEIGKIKINQFNVEANTLQNQIKKQISDGNKVLDSFNTKQEENASFSKMDDDRVSPRNIEVIFTEKDNPQESANELAVADDEGKQVVYEPVTVQSQRLSVLRDRKLPAVDIEIENLDNSPDPEMSEEVVFEKKILPPGINDRYIFYFLMVQFAANLFVNIDMGILPAGSLKIKAELQIENTKFGFLGSVVYFGQTIGAALATGALQGCNPKMVLGLCLFLNIGTLLLFTQTNYYFVLVFCRCCTGLFQVFFAVYFPVWADTYGDEHQKSNWLTYLLISSPLGVIMGYGMCASFLDNIGWRWAFYIQAMLLMPSLIGIFLIPIEYIDIQACQKKMKSMKKEANKLKEDAKQPAQLKNLQSIPDDDEPKNNEILEEDINRMKEGAEEIGTKQMQNNINNPETEEYVEEEYDTDYSGDENDLEDIDQSFCSRIKDVLSNKYYLLLCLSLTFLYYIITGIQFWISDYWINTLMVPEEIVFISFGIISITGPVLGVVVGGNITTKLGGYNSEKAAKICALTSIFCLGCAMPIPFLSNFKIVAVLLWFLLFFGGAILPAMTGMMLNTVQPEQKTAASSLAAVSYNLLGYLPAPFVYGAIYDSGEGGHSREAMATLMFSPIISASALISAVYLIRRDNVLGYRKE